MVKVAAGLFTERLTDGVFANRLTWNTVTFSLPCGALNAAAHGCGMSEREVNQLDVVRRDFDH